MNIKRFNHIKIYLDFELKFAATCRCDRKLDFIKEMKNTQPVVVDKFKMPFFALSNHLLPTECDDIAVSRRVFISNVNLFVFSYSYLFSLATYRTETTVWSFSEKHLCLSLFLNKVAINFASTEYYGFILFN